MNFPERVWEPTGTKTVKDGDREREVTVFASRPAHRKIKQDDRNWLRSLTTPNHMVER